VICRGIYGTCWHGGLGKEQYFRQYSRDLNQVPAEYSAMRKAYKILVEKPETKRPLERPRRIWGNNIKMDLKRRCEGVDWILLARDSVQLWCLVNVVMHLLGSIRTGNLLSSRAIISCRKGLCCM
jgi:hypothetical protein